MRRSVSALWVHAPVWYREVGEVRMVTRETFRELARAGSVGPDTRVFDTSLTRIAEFRAGGLERPAQESWHGKVFFREGAAALGVRPAPG